MSKTIQTQVESFDLSVLVPSGSKVGKVYLVQRINGKWRCEESKHNPCMGWRFTKYGSAPEDNCEHDKKACSHIRKAKELLK